MINQSKSEKKPEPVYVWAHCSFEDAEDGVVLVDLYATEQTARQAVSKAGYGWVLKKLVRTKVPF